MKSLLLSISLVFVSAIAQARVNVLECGLPEWMEEEGAIIELAGGKSLKKGVELTDLQKQQIVIAARALLNPNFTSTVITSTSQAIDLLNKYTESGEGDSFIENFKVNGYKQVYTQVKFYPGGNPVGVIFLGGSKTIIATNGDSSISCVE